MMASHTQATVANLLIAPKLGTWVCSLYPDMVHAFPPMYGMLFTDNPFSFEAFLAKGSIEDGDEGSESDDPFAPSLTTQGTARTATKPEMTSSTEQRKAKVKAKRKGTTKTKPSKSEVCRLWAKPSSFNRFVMVNQTYLLRMSV
eukprot:m.108191 g.108191  ORF g.108191 m.108191 type:complete len:144 (+) comp13338_c0_seq7:458-889(+)